MWNKINLKQNRQHCLLFSIIQRNKQHNNRKKKFMRNFASNETLKMKWKKGCFLSPMLKRNKHLDKANITVLKTFSTQWSKAKTHNLQRTKEKIPTILSFLKNHKFNFIWKKCFSNVNFVICKMTTISISQDWKIEIKNSTLMIEWI